MTDNLKEELNNFFTVKNPVKGGDTPPDNEVAKQINEFYADKTPTMGTPEPNYEIPGVHQVGDLMKSKYDVGVSYTNLDRLDKIRADRQSRMAQLGNAVNQAIVGEIVGGTLEGIGYLLDLPGVLNSMMQREEEFGNWFSDLGKDLRTWTKEATPVYSSHPGEFAPGSWSWWMDNFPSVASTLSLMIPSMGAVKGVTMLGQAMKLISKTGKALPYIEGIASAIVSRFMENTMEASSVMDSKYKEYLDKGMPEAQARKAAAQGAQSVFNANWAMLAQDIPQYLMLGKLRLKAPSSVAVERELAKRGVRNAVNKTLALNTAKGLKSAAGEGFEEAYQYVIQEEGERMADLVSGYTQDDNSTLGERIKSYMGKGDFWTSAAFGAIGGGVFQAVGSRVSDAIDNARGIMSEDKKRVNNIKKRGSHYAKLSTLGEEALELGDDDAINAARQNIMLDLVDQAFINKNHDSLIDDMKAAKEEFGLSDEDITETQKIMDLYKANIKAGVEPFFTGKLTRAQYMTGIYTDSIKNSEQKLNELKSQIPTFENEKQNWGMSDTGLEILHAETNLAGYKKALAFIQERLKSKDLIPERRESYEASVKRYEKVIKIAEDNLAQMKKDDPRTAERKNTDQSVADTLPVREMDNLQFNIAMSITSLEHLGKTKKNLENKKWRAKKLEEIIKRDTELKKKAAKNAAKNTPSEDLKNEAQNNPDEDIQNIAQDEMDDRVNTQAKEATPIVSGRNISDRYSKNNILVHNDLLNSEMEELRDTLSKADQNNPYIKSLVAILNRDNYKDQRSGNFKQALFNDTVTSFIRDKIYSDAVIPEKPGADKDGVTWTQEEINKRKADNAIKEEARTIIDTFFQGKKTVVDKEAVQTSTNIPEDTDNVYIESFDEESGEFEGQERVDGKVDKDLANPSDSNPMSTHTPEFSMEENKKAFKRGENGKFVPNQLNKDLFHIDFFTLNDPDLVQVGDEITFIVDLGAMQTKFTEKFLKQRGLKGLTISELLAYPDYIQDGMIRIVHTKTSRVIGVLPAMNGFNSKTEQLFPMFNESDALGQLWQLRKDIFNAIAEQYKTDKSNIQFSNINLKISKKHGGRFSNVSRTEAVTQKRNPKQVLRKGTPLIFGIAIEQGDTTVLKVPNRPDLDNMVGKFKKGGVYVFVKDASGKLVPSRVRTKPVGTFTEKVKEINDLLKTLTKENRTEIHKKLNDIVYIYRLDYNAENDTIYINFKAGGTKYAIKKSEIETNKDFREALNHVPVQVALRKINGAKAEVKSEFNGHETYNDMICEEGRVWTDLTPSDNIHSSRIDISPYKAGVVPTKSTSPSNAEVVVETPTETTSSVSTNSREQELKIADQKQEEFNKIISPATRDTKGALKDLKYFLVDNFGWDRNFKIGYDGKSFTFEVNGVKFEVKGSGSTLGGGVTFLEVSLKDIINAKYNAELATKSEPTIVDEPSTGETVKDEKSIIDLLQQGLDNATMDDDVTDLKGDAAPGTQGKEESPVPKKTEESPQIGTIISAAMTEQGKSIEIEVIGESGKEFLITINRGGTISIFDEKQKDGTYKTGEGHMSLTQRKYLVDKYIPESLISAIDNWKNAFTGSWADETSEAGKRYNEAEKNLLSEFNKSINNKKSDKKAPPNTPNIFGIKPQPKKRTKTTEKYKVWNEQEETAWFKKNFPDVPIEVMENLKEVFSHGDEGWGMFHNASVFIAKNAATGTAYHEAFHVIFWLYLTPEQRASIMQDEFGYTVKDDKNIPSKLEEQLADKFMNYIQTELEDKSLKARTNRFFKGLWSFIQSLFNKKNTSMKSLVNQAVSNYYRFKKPLPRVKGFTSDIYRMRVAGMNSVAEQQRRITVINDMFFRLIDYYRNTDENFADATDNQIIKAKGINAIYSDVEAQFLVLRNNGGYDAADVAKFDAILKSFIIGKDEKNNNVYGDLGQYAIRDLRERGVSLTLKNKTILVKNTKNLHVEDQYDTENSFDEEANNVEGWQVNILKQSGKDKLSREIKTLLSLLPVPALNEKNEIIYDETEDGVKKIRYDVDDLGFPRYYNFDTVYAELKRKLSNTYTESGMLEKLNQLLSLHPEYETIISALERFPIYRTKFVVDMMKSQLGFMQVLKREDGEYRVFDVTKTNSYGIVADNWKFGLENPPSKSNFILDLKGNIRPDIAVKAQNDLDHLISIIQEKDRRGEKIDDSDHILLLNALQYFNTDLTIEDLRKLATPYNGLTSYTNYSRFLNNLKLGFVDKFAAGTNPFDVTYNESKEITRVFRTVAGLRVALREDSFLNSENEMSYSHIVPNFMTKLITAFKNNDKKLIEKYLSTPFYANNIWLKAIADDANVDLRDQLEFVLLNGYKDESRDKGTTYEKLSEADLETVAINMYLNNGRDNNYGYFRTPIFSDTPVMGFIKFKKYKDPEAIVQRLYEVALQEEARMKQISMRDSEGKRIYKNFNKRGKKFLYLPVLNKEFLGVDIAANEERVKSTIRNWMEQRFEKYYEKGISIGIIDRSTGNSSVISSIVKEDEQKTFLKEYFYDSFFATMMIGQLTSGDRAFYKNEADYQKRNKQVWSPGTYLNTEAEWEGEKVVGGTYTSIYIKDNEVKSEHLEVLKEMLQSRVDKGKMNEDTMYSILAKYGYTNSEVKGKPVALAPHTRNYFFTKSINQTDGQGYMTLSRYRKIQIGLGRWNHTLQRSYDRLLSGSGTSNDVNLVMNPIKPFVYQMVKDDNLLVPTQHKNSETVLLPQLAYRTTEGNVDFPSPKDLRDNFSRFKSPKLAKLLYTMSRNGIDSAQFESVVKVGLPVNSENKTKTLDELSDSLNSTPLGELLQNKDVQYLDNSEWRLQQETPEHHMDEKNIFGTQIKKLFLGDISPAATFEYNGKTYTKGEVFDVWNKLHTQDIIEEYNGIATDFKDINSIREMLLEEINARGLDSQYEEALDLIKINEKGDLDFKLPLYHPLHSRRIESLITSIYKNRVTKQKIHGGAFVQVSNFGFSNKLRLNKEKGLEYAEVMLPWSSARYFEPLLDKDGFLDVNRIPKDQRDLLNMIGYRIPTEDKYSMMPLKVVGFTPQEMGGVIILPAEITTISGSDFDIDKMYIMMPNFDVVVDRDFLFDELKKKGHDLGGNKRKLNGYLYNNMNSFRGKHRTIKHDLTEIIKSNPNKYIIKKTTYDLNNIEGLGKTARSNAEIDLLWSVLTNEDTFDKFINPGGFDNVVRLANITILLESGIKKGDILHLSNEELQEKVDKLQENEEYLTDFPDDWLEQFNRNMTGANLIGIFANHNALHSVMQYSELELADGLEIVFNGDERGKALNRIKKLKGLDYISRTLSSFLAASVDNNKNPIAYYINMSTFTADSIALLTKLGFDELTVNAFITQPVLKELNRRFFNYGGNRQAESRALKEIADEIRFSINKFSSKPFEKSEINYNFFTGAMMDDITESKNIKDKLNNIENLKVEKLTGETDQAHYERTLKVREDERRKIFTENRAYFVRQLNILHAFKTYKEIASSYGDVMRALRFDVIGTGPTSATSEILLRRINKALSHNKMFNNLTDIVPNLRRDGKYPIFDNFYRYGIYLPIYDRILSDKEKAEFESLSDKEKALDNRKLLGKMNGLATRFPFFNRNFIAIKNIIEENLDILGNTIQEDDIAHANYQILSYLITGHPFFKDLTPNRLEVIVKNTPTDFQDFLEKHPELHSNEFIKRITPDRPEGSPINILKYNNNAALSNTEKSTIAQNWEELLNSPNKEIADFAFRLVQYSLLSNQFTFNPYTFSHLIPVDFFSNISNINDYLRNEVLNDKGTPNTFEISAFLDQYYRNFWYKENLVPSVKKDLSNITGEVHRVGNTPAFIYVDPTDANTSPGFFKATKNPNQPFLFVKYIKFYDKATKQMYLFRRTKYRGVYSVVSKLGVPNHAIEYAKNEMGKESMFVANREQVVYTEEDFIKYVNGLRTKNAIFEEVTEDAGYATVVDNFFELRLPAPDHVIPLNQQTGKYKWGKSDENSFEVSTAANNPKYGNPVGDKRFSAFNAKLSDGRSIEEAYQLDVKGYRAEADEAVMIGAIKSSDAWRFGKGKKPKTDMSQEQLYAAYKALWKQWAAENPSLIEELKKLADGKVLTDRFITSPVNQARALAEILNEGISEGITEGIKSELLTDEKGTLNKAKEIFVRDKSRIISTVKSEIKEGVSELFESNPELATIGTQEQYSQYLDTIFPDSKVKDIVYHATNTKFDKFKVGKYASSIFFAPTKEEVWKSKGDVTISALINSINPKTILNNKVIRGEKDFDSVYTDYTREYIESLPDDIREHGEIFREISVDNPEQIHILGSKQDIEGFKEFVGKPSISIKDVYNNPNQLSLDFNTPTIEATPAEGTVKQSESNAAENDSQYYESDYQEDIGGEYIDNADLDIFKFLPPDASVGEEESSPMEEHIFGQNENISDIITAVLDNLPDEERPYTRRMFERLMPIFEREDLKDVKVKVIPGKELDELSNREAKALPEEYASRKTLGLAHYRSKTIYLRKGRVSMKTLLHEMLHFASVEALEQNGVLAQEFKKLFNHYKAQAPDLYGFVDEHEFLTTLWTDVNMMKYLESVPATNKKVYSSLWKEFVDLMYRMINSLLGKNPIIGRTALEQAMDLSAAMIEEHDQNKRDRFDAEQTYRDYINTLTEEELNDVENLELPPFYEPEASKDIPSNPSDIVKDIKKVTKLHKREVTELQKNLALKRLGIYNKNSGKKHRIVFDRVGQADLYTYKIVPDTSEFFQTEAKAKEAANAELDNRLKSLLSQMGIEVQTVDKIAERMGISPVAVSDMLNKVIKIAKGKADIETLPEEFSHFFMEALGDEHPLMRRMLKLMEEEKYKEILGSEYDKYYALYGGDINKIKKEAAGKLLAESIINKFKDENTSDLIRALRNILKYVLKLFRSAEENAFNKEVEAIFGKTATNILAGDISDTTARALAESKESFFYNIKGQDLGRYEKALIEAINVLNKKIKIRYGKGVEDYSNVDKKLLFDLTEKLEDEQTTLGVVKFLKHLKSEFVNIDKKLLELKKRGKELDSEDIAELASELRKLKSYVNAYAQPLEDLQKDIESDIEMKFKDKVIYKTIEDLLKVINRANNQYYKIGIPIFAKFLKPFAGTGYTEEQLIKTLQLADKDISFWERWLDSLAESSDDILRLINEVVGQSKDGSRLQSLDDQKELLEALSALEKAGIKDTEFVYERDKKGELTGYFLTKTNIGQFEQDKSNFFESLFERFNLKRDGKKVTAFDFMTRKEFYRWYQENKSKPDVIAIEDKFKSGRYRENFSSEEQFMTRLKEEISKEYNKEIALWFKEHAQPREDAAAVVEAKRKEMLGENPEKLTKEERERRQANFEAWYNKVVGISTYYDVNEGYYVNVKYYKGALSVPNENIYGNEAYKNLSPAQKEFLDVILKKKQELDNLLPEKFRRANKSPQIRKDFIERLKSAKSLKKAGNILKEYKDTFILREDETERGSQIYDPTEMKAITDEEGNIVNFLPILFVRDIKNREIMSTDVISTMSMFSNMARDYSNMNKILDILEMGKDIIGERKVSEVDFRGKPLRSLLSDIGTEIQKRVAPKRGKEKNVYARLKDYYDMVIYGKYKADEGSLFGTSIDRAKAVDFFGKYVAIQGLAFNVFAGIQNPILGNALIRQEAIAGEYYNNKNLLWADTTYAAALPKRLGQLGKRNITDKLGLWCELTDALQSWHEDIHNVTGIKKTRLSKLFNSSALFFINNIGEHQMQLRTSLALADSIKLKDANGKIYNLYEAFVVDGNKLVMREGLTKLDGTDFTQDDFVAFTRKSNFINKRLHGIYNQRDRAALQRMSLGRLAIMFRKWIKPGLNRRFDKSMFNFEAGVEVEGYYRTFGNFINALRKDIGRGQFLMMQHWNDLSSHQRANMFRSFAELGYLIAASVLATILLNLADDDDDDWLLNMSAYQSRRFITEIGFYIPILGTGEMLKIIKSPAAGVSVLDDMLEFLHVWEWNNEIERGRFEGHTQFYKRGTKLIPMYNQVAGALYPEDKLIYFSGY